MRHLGNQVPEIQAHKRYGQWNGGVHLIHDGHMMITARSRLLLRDHHHECQQREIYLPMHGQFDQSCA